MAAFRNTIRIFDGLMYVVVIVAGGIFYDTGIDFTCGSGCLYNVCNHALATIRRIIEFAEQFQREMTGIETVY